MLWVFNGASVHVDEFRNKRFEGPVASPFDCFLGFLVMELFVVEQEADLAAKFIYVVLHHESTVVSLHHIDCPHLPDCNDRNSRAHRFERDKPLCFGLAWEYKNFSKAVVVDDIF